VEIASPLEQWYLAMGEQMTRRMWSPRIAADPLDMEGEAAAEAALSRCLSSTERIPEGRRRVRSIQGQWRALSGEGRRRSYLRCGAAGGGARDSWRPHLLCSWRPRLLCSWSGRGRLAGVLAGVRGLADVDQQPSSGAGRSSSVGLAF